METTQEPPDQQDKLAPVLEQAAEEAVRDSNSDQNQEPAPLIEATAQEIIIDGENGQNESPPGDEVTGQEVAEDQDNGQNGGESEPAIVVDQEVAEGTGDGQDQGMLPQGMEQQEVAKDQTFELTQSDRIAPEDPQ